MSTGIPTRRGPGAISEALGTGERILSGTIRRMVINVTGNLWRVLGHLLPDSKREARDAEVFSGVGFYARPPEGANAEAVVAFPGGAAGPIVIAARDEATRQASAAIDPDESVIFNSVARVLVRADGTVEITSIGGGAVALAKASDLSRFMTALIAAITALGGSPSAPELSALKTALEALIPAWPDGTTVLKGE